LATYFDPIGSSSGLHQLTINYVHFWEPKHCLGFQECTQLYSYRLGSQEYTQLYSYRLGSQ